LLTLHSIKETPLAERSTTTAAQVMIPAARMKTVRPGTDLWAALAEMDRGGVNQLPVMTDGHVLGMLSRGDVVSFLRTLRGIGPDHR
jgi:CBS domain-containing protein